MLFRPRRRRLNEEAAAKAVPLPVDIWKRFPVILELQIWTKNY
jgi:hypothetical protein